ncbi:pathogenesis-related protein 1-like [Iris pallida]|uniref:Pathogenesis-related protein 1-like n=1 Tax=Iris pallida TaxID=29817 RepID=A0AAX6HX39_IRIPA|nr:pathogenesis-related protein 1-like [Iris pallida]
MSWSQEIESPVAASRLFKAAYLDWHNPARRSCRNSWSAPLLFQEMAAWGALGSSILHQKIHTRTGRRSWTSSTTRSSRPPRAWLKEATWARSSRPCPSISSSSRRVPPTGVRREDRRDCEGHPRGRGRGGNVRQGEGRTDGEVQGRRGLLAGQSNCLCVTMNSHYCGVLN